MSKVAGYVRVSTEKQKQEGSHKRQQEYLEEWAEREGHQLTIYQDIAISGQSDERDAYDRLMNELETYDIVAVRELSRFGRSLKRVLTDIETLQDHGIKFVSLREDFSTDSAMGTAMLQMIGAFNEFWANLARERAIENVERRRENGDPIGRPKKLDAKQRDDVRELREAGVSYASIARVMETREDTPDSISRETIRTYCKENAS